MRAVLRPVLTVPETRAADDLLEDMRSARRHLALVVDEYGGTAGIVTLGDVLRTLVGRIDDEAALGSAQTGIGRTSRAESDGSQILDGLMKVHEFEEAIGSALGDEQREGVATLGGLITKLLNRLPVVADEVRVAGRQLRVEHLDGRRVTTVRLLPEIPTTGVD
jgi:CBS domain containing-hemolysin-like protein